MYLDVDDSQYAVEHSENMALDVRTIQTERYPSDIFGQHEFGQHDYTDYTVYHIHWNWNHHAIFMRFDSSR